MDPILPNPWDAVPEDRKWKYAYCERERRFLLPAKPKLPEHKPAIQLLDKYLTNTNFRLRKADSGTTCEYKLQKKLRLQVGFTDQLWNSTIYISEAEYELFRPLPGHWLEKRRTFYQGASGETICVDEIAHSDQTIYIAEVEFPDAAAMADYTFGLEYSRELTNQPGWSCYDLAIAQ